MIIILYIFLSEQCHKYVLIEFLIICFVKQVHIAYFGSDTSLALKRPSDRVLSTGQNSPRVLDLSSL